MKTPYKGLLSREQKAYNDALIPKRVVVERAFGYLKGKFQRFRHENSNGHEKNTVKAFFAAAIIHNLTIEEAMGFDNDDIIEEIIAEERQHDN